MVLELFYILTVVMDAEVLNENVVYNLKHKQISKLKLGKADQWLTLISTSNCGIIL